MEALRKIDGYREIFEDENGNPKIFNKDGLEIKVVFRFYNKGKSVKGYQKYFVGKIEDLRSVLDNT